MENENGGQPHKKIRVQINSDQLPAGNGKDVTGIDHASESESQRDDRANGGREDVLVAAVVTINPTAEPGTAEREMVAAVDGLTPLSVLSEHAAGSSGAPLVSGTAASVDVFVGGLPVDISQDTVQEAMSAAGVVLSVRLQLERSTGKCKGYAFVSFTNSAAAKAACSITEIAGMPVGVHVCRALSDMGPSVHSLLAPSSSPAILPPSDESSSLAQLMAMLQGQEDKPAAIAVAMRAIQTHFAPAATAAATAAAPKGTTNGTASASVSKLDIASTTSKPSAAAVVADPAARKAASAAPPAGPKEAGGPGSKGALTTHTWYTPPAAPTPVLPPKAKNAKGAAATATTATAGAAPAAAGVTAGQGPTVKAPGGGKAKKIQPDPSVKVVGGAPVAAVVEDATDFLDEFPATKRMLERFHAVPATENKSSLSLVHEYAARLALEYTCTQSTEGEENAVVFVTSGVMAVPRGGKVHGQGTGRGRSKKLSRQVAAAALLEHLLLSVPEQDFFVVKPLAVPRVQVPKSGLGYPTAKRESRGGRSGPQTATGQSGGQPSFTGPQRAMQGNRYGFDSAAYTGGSGSGPMANASRNSSHLHAYSPAHMSPAHHPQQQQQKQSQQQQHHHQQQQGWQDPQTEWGPNRLTPTGSNVRQSMSYEHQQQGYGITPSREPEWVAGQQGLYQGQNQQQHQHQQPYGVQGSIIYGGLSGNFAPQQQHQPPAPSPPPQQQLQQPPQNHVQGAFQNNPDSGGSTPPPHHISGYTSYHSSTGLTSPYHPPGSVGNGREHSGGEGPSNAAQFHAQGGVGNRGEAHVDGNGNGVAAAIDLLGNSLYGEAAGQKRNFSSAMQMQQGPGMAGLSLASGPPGLGMRYGEGGYNNGADYGQQQQQPQQQEQQQY